MRCVYITHYSHSTHQLFTKVYVTMVMIIAIRNVLTTCGFTVPHERDYLTTNEGLDSWDALILIDFDDFGDTAKAALQCLVDLFTIGAVKIKALKALKFWIED